MKVSIIGTTGYGGAELVRILHNHPVLNIHSIHSTKTDIEIVEEYPHMTNLIGHILEEIDYDQIAEQSDVVFLATPSGISGKTAEQFLKRNIKVIDLSGDLRLKNSEDYKAWYKKDSVDASVLKEAVYGLSEWNKPLIQNARVIANPGCYPTAALLGMAPVIVNNLIDPSSIIIDAKSGTSGAGRSPSRSIIFSEINENFKIYKVNEHQHTPEIEQQLFDWNHSIRPITFSTHLLPITRGIMTTIYVQLTKEYKTSEMIDLYKETYNKSPFIRVRKEGTFPAVKEVCSSNFCDIGLHVDDRTGRLTIVSTIDNLMKGAAGQAVQNANIMFGIDEGAGLQFTPLYP